MKKHTSLDVCLETEIENYLRCFDRFLLKLRGSFSIHADEFALRALVLEFYKALDQCDRGLCVSTAEKVNQVLALVSVETRASICD